MLRSTTVTVISLDSPDGESSEVRGGELLVATGRRPNTDQLEVEAGRIAVDDRGFVVTDHQLRTNVEGVWALGDITNPVQLSTLPTMRPGGCATISPTRTARQPWTTGSSLMRCSAIPRSPASVSPSRSRRWRIPYVSHVQPYAAAAYGYDAA